MIETVRAVVRVRARARVMVMVIVRARLQCAKGTTIRSTDSGSGRVGSGRVRGVKCR